jgi:hypothetical protein
LIHWEFAQCSFFFLNGESLSDILVCQEAFFDKKLADFQGGGLSLPFILTP